MKIVADIQLIHLQHYFNSHDLIFKKGRLISSPIIQDADLLLIRSVTQINRDLLKDSKVKFVGSVTSGIDHMDTAWLDASGIAWSAVPGLNAKAVRDYVKRAVTIFMQKQLLKGKKAAVIGVGRIGRLVVEYLNALGFEVLTCDPWRGEQENNFTSIPLHELENLDLISLHVPLTYQKPHATYHMIDESFLAKQNNGCIIINTSRGSVADTQALLRHGKRLIYCFDVWEGEPEINLKLLEQTFIATPHLAGYSIQSKMRGAKMIYQAMVDKRIISSTSTNKLPPQEDSSSTFDLLAITSTMKTSLVKANKCSEAFDKLRHSVPLRNENDGKIIINEI